MPADRNFARLTTVLIIGVVILSGPVLPVMDFTPESVSEVNQSHSASVSIYEESKSAIKIAPGRFGAGIYLFGPSITVVVEAVSGSPILVYELQVPGLHRNVVDVTFLDETEAGQHLTLDMERSSIPVEQIDKKRYLAVIELRLRAGDETKIVMRQNLTVIVEGIDGSDSS